MTTSNSKKEKHVFSLNQNKTNLYKKNRTLSLIYSIAITLLLLLSNSSIFAQGCMPARHIPPNLGTNGLSYLIDGEWDVGISYRYLYSNTFFIGTEPQHQYKEQGLNSNFHHHSFNLSTRYSVNQRLSFTLNVPLMTVFDSDIHYDGLRHTQKSGLQLGDMRIVGNYWLKDPLTAEKGNIAVGFGFKLPTAKEDLQGTFYNFDGQPTTRDYDIALQPGNGGFGIITELSWFQPFNEQFSLMVNAHYVISPKNTNNSVVQWFEPTDPYFSSIADQFNLNTRLTYSIGKFAISAGLRLDGIPLNDLIGKSDGFRRPGEILYLDNGLMWSNYMNTFSISLPYALHRNIRTSNLDKNLGIETLGGLADFLTLVSYSRRF